MRLHYNSPRQNTAALPLGIVKEVDQDENFKEKDCLKESFADIMSMGNNSGGNQNSEHRRSFPRSHKGQYDSQSLDNKVTSEMVWAHNYDEDTADWMETMVLK